MDAAEILRRYDSDVRSRAEAPAPGFSIVWEGPILRMVGPGPEAHANGVLFSRLEESSADALIAGEIAFFGAGGRAFEWKLFDYDTPADLGDRLIRAGFVPDPPETFVVHEIGSRAAFRTSRKAWRSGVSAPASTAPSRSVNEAVYGRPDHARWLFETIAAEQRAAPDSLAVYAAFAGADPVSVGWLRHRPGDAFGSLWGGATLAQWRGQGLYSALVGARVAEAAERGCRWLTVDCSPMSLPILERCGFRPLATTTPFIWTPP
jgi:GNAT superfamily N-acetyltransferase